MRTYDYPIPRIDKLSQTLKFELFLDLINAFGTLKSPIDSSLFLNDLLTAKEIRTLSIRLRIAKLILSGSKEREIADQLHCSFGTIAKVRSWLEEGGEGLVKTIKSLPPKYNFPKNLPPGPIEYHLPQILLASVQYILHKKQKGLVDTFTDKVGSKRLLDKKLQESISDFYKKKKTLKV